MSTIVVASLQQHAGRTAVTAGLGARSATAGRLVRLLRLRSVDGTDPAAEDDAKTFAAVAGCAAPDHAVTEQDALAEVRGAGESLVLVEAPHGTAEELAEKLAARVIFVTSDVSDLVLGDLAAAAARLGEALAGVIAMRQPERMLASVVAAMQERGITSLGVVPEDRLLAGPSPREMAEALHASTLVEGEGHEEAVEFVMLGPVSADPGQPYFLQHSGKAVVNRFNKMDLHLAALATRPACLILTGGQQPSSYLIDRVAGCDPPVPVLLSPEGTARTMELVDGVYGETRFSGRRKLDRVIQLFERHIDPKILTEAIG